MVRGRRVRRVKDVRKKGNRSQVRSWRGARGGERPLTRIFGWRVVLLQGVELVGVEMGEGALVSGERWLGKECVFVCVCIYMCVDNPLCDAVWDRVRTGYIYWQRGCSTGVVFMTLL